MFAYEKRRGARQRRSYRVALGPFSSQTVDVSSTGFCAQSTRPLRRGSDVEGAMKVGDRWVAFGGQVAWSSPACARAGGKVGVRFTRVPWDLQRVLDG